MGDVTTLLSSPHARCLPHAVYGTCTEVDLYSPTALLRRPLVRAGAVGAEWLAEFKKFIDNPISLLL